MQYDPVVVCTMDDQVKHARSVMRQGAPANKYKAHTYFWPGPFGHM